MNQFITLIAGVTCYLAGLHLDRRFLLPRHRTHRRELLLLTISRLTPGLWSAWP